jgi:hypothetical protein
MPSLAYRHRSDCPWTKPEDAKKKGGKGEGEKTMFRRWPIVHVMSYELTTHSSYTYKYTTNELINQSADRLNRHDRRGSNPVHNSCLTQRVPKNDIKSSSQRTRPFQLPLERYVAVSMDPDFVWSKCGSKFIWNLKIQLRIYIHLYNRYWIRFGS